MGKLYLCIEFDDQYITNRVLCVFGVICLFEFLEG